MRQTPIFILHVSFIILATALPLGAAPYSDNGNGAVTDQKSGLVWQKCSMGLNNDALCSGTATMANWVNALSYCENLSLGGRTDWRLPNVNELKSIVNETSYNPAIDSSVFPGTVVGFYWSSSAYVNSPDSAWYVSFGVGYSNYIFRTNNSGYVRCVAGP